MRVSDLLSKYETRYSSLPKLSTYNVGPETLSASIEHVGCNSGAVGKNWLFCCIRGESRDGHDFAAEAIHNGASVLLSVHPLPLEVPQIISSDVRRDMGRISSIVYGEPALKMKMFAVTGTNGKSTTTWIIRHLLQSLGLRTGLMGTIIYSDGADEQDAGRTTPESCDIQHLLAKMVRNGCSACVMETSSHGLDLGRIEGCSFDGAVFTNLSEEHLDYHGTLECYFNVKARLFASYMKQGWSGGVNTDDAYGKRLFDMYPENFLPFGLNEKRTDALRGRDISCSLSGTAFSVSLPGTEAGIPLDFPLPGRFNVYNALAALSVTLPFASDVNMLLQALSTMVQVPGRMETFSFDNGLCCIIDFAHTPEALKNVLTEVRKLCRGKIFSVFGHGGERFQPNRFSLGMIAAALADEIIVTMDNPRNEAPEQIALQIAEGVRAGERTVSLKTILDRPEAVRTAMDAAKPGDVVVVSGKGPEKFLQIGSSSIPYSDGDEVRRWAGERGLCWR